MKYFNAALLIAIVTPAIAITLSELPEGAKALLPKGRPALITKKDGIVRNGMIIFDSENMIKIDVMQESGTWMTYSVLKSDIKSIKDTDVENLWFEKLTEFKLDEKRALDIERYNTAIERFDEFLKLCPDSVHAAIVKTQRSAFDSERVLLLKGREKVEGEWLTPVRAAVRWFDVYTERIETLSKRPDSTKNPRVKDAIETSLTDRREVARKLPKLTKERVEELVSEKNFEEAADEMNAFLDFWLQQVICSEGPAAKAFEQMDFTYVRDLQKHFMDAYKLANPVPAKKIIKGGMVFVPAGYTCVGNPNALSIKDTAFPARIVYVDAFWIDLHEVSYGNYRKFFDHVKNTRDDSMEHPDSPPMKKHDPAAGWGADNQPVMGVDWFDAYAYAKWSGKRLPTEAEWEKAARMLETFKYPWGDESPEKVAANYAPGRRALAKEMDRQNPPKSPEAQKSRGCFKKSEPPPPPPPTRLPDVVWPVDSQLAPEAMSAIASMELTWNKSTDSSIGCMHMADNASEWVNDFYKPDAYLTMAGRNPQGPKDGVLHVFRGGNYLSENDDEMIIWTRNAPIGKKNSDNIISGIDSKKRPFIGFRCVKNAD